MASSLRSRTARKLSAPLLVAADGRNSKTREAAGINVARWKYDHQAIVSVLRHERPHEHVAYEIFYPSGPFALLPMNDDARRPPLGDRLVGAEGGCGRLAVAERRGFRRRGRGRDGRLPRQGRDARAALVLPARLPPCGADHRAGGWRWSATPRMRSIRSPARGSTSASATPRRWPKCWSKARGWGSTSATGNCSTATSAGARSMRFRSPSPPTA